MGDFVAKFGRDPKANAASDEAKEVARALAVFNDEDDATEKGCGLPNTEDEIAPNIDVFVQMNKACTVISQ